jgi:putative ABC transport system permease protein
VLVAALRDLQWRRRRFLIAVLGTALVFAMTLLLAGLSAAFGNEVDRTVETTGADAWVVADGVTGPFNSSSVLPAESLAAVRELPGVQDADPFIAIGGTMTGDEAEKITMIGAVPGGVGSPTVDDGRAPRRSGEVAVGSRLGPDVGDTIEIGGRDFTVVGVVDGSSLFGGMPNVFMTVEDVQRTTFAGASLFTSIAVEGTPRGSVDGTDVVSITDTKDDLLDAMGSGIQTINVLAILLWFVAACIVGSVIYLSALERVRDFAVFKATGTGTGALLGGLALQSVIVSVIAALIGAVIALLVAPSFPMPAEIPQAMLIALPIVAIVVGGLASLAGLRRAVTVSPALAFGG